MSNKIGMATVAGNLEAGEIVKENTYTCHIQFKKLPRQPILTKRKRDVKLILGDRWESDK